MVERRRFFLKPKIFEFLGSGPPRCFPLDRTGSGGQPPLPARPFQFAVPRTSRFHFDSNMYIYSLLCQRVRITGAIYFYYGGNVGRLSACTGLWRL